jgi:hypothetical protein
MNLDRLIHESKNFAELADADIEVFLRNRLFRSENLNIEFKQGFPQKQGGRYDIKEICKYIVGLSNEEGGLVIYGVSDNIKDASVAYPAYVSGLQNYPSLEDLGQWAKDRIHPLIVSPSIRFFSVAGQTVAILKIPAGVNKPYCYHDPGANTVTYFKRTSGGIAQLTPDEIREFHRTQMLDQAIQLLRGADSVASYPSSATLGRVGNRIEQHKQAVSPKIENLTDFGLVGIYCFPLAFIQIPVDHLIKFLEAHRFHFSELMRHFPAVEVFQNGASVGFFPRAVRQDIKSTARFTLYSDGFVAFDALADTFMDGDKDLNPFWLAYETQRQLQLAKALLTEFGVERIRVIVDLENVQGFSMTVAEPFGRASSKYVGPHGPVIREVSLSEVHDFGEASRNIAMPVVKDIMNEVSRIFGFSAAWPGLWDAAGNLAYVKGIEHQR